VGYSELGAHGWVSPSHYLRYLVETAYDWAEANQLGMQESEQLGLAWVIRETELEIIRPLRFNEGFDFTIWLMEWRKVRGRRGFKITLADSGELVAQGAQQVVSLDAHSLRPITPPERFMESFRLEEPPIVHLSPFPLDIPGRGELFRMNRSVEWRDLDTMDMVYNAVYIDYVEDAVRQALAGQGWTPGYMKAEGLALALEKLHAKYLLPARWEDEIGIETHLIKVNDSRVMGYVDLVRHPSLEKIVSISSVWKYVKST
jgi:YbgC/YbaW family acyl-CoA thioester hydrolase